MLADRYGMAADHFDFGCDLDRYGLPEAPPGAEPVARACASSPGRSRPGAAFDLGVLALEVFAARRPDVDIHLFGDPVGRLSFPATDHGVLTPDELNRLYQRCAAGLVLSATNVSLVPHEMLASGCIPVVNDAEHNRDRPRQPPRRLRARRPPTTSPTRCAAWSIARAAGDGGRRRRRPRQRAGALVGRRRGRGRADHPPGLVDGGRHGA